MRINDLLVDGLAIGTGYALLAIGWTVLLGAARLVNFAQGQLYMLGGFTTWWLSDQFSLPYFASVPIIIVGGALLGLVLQVVLGRLVQERNLTSIMLATLAVGYVIQGVAGLTFGGDPQIVPSPLSNEQLTVVGSDLTGQDALIIVLAVVMYAGVWYVLRKTRAGSYVRAVSEDSSLASLYGINTTWVYAGVLAFATVAAVLAGWAMTPRGPILTTIGFQEVIITFAVVVIGGIGRIWGNFAAAMGLGLFVVLIGQLWVPAYALAATFAIVIAFLVVRPQEVALR